MPRTLERAIDLCHAWSLSIGFRHLLCLLAGVAVGIPLGFLVQVELLEALSATDALQEIWQVPLLNMAQ